MDLARLRTSMSSSDLSHSSGASNQSTRDTSPDSPHGLRGAAANKLAARLDLVKLSDPIDDMDRSGGGGGGGNPFRTASERRERPSLLSQEQQFRAAQQAKTNPGRNLGLAAGAGSLPGPRSVASTNWRAPGPSGLFEPGSYGRGLRAPSSPAGGAYARSDVFAPPPAEQAAGGAGDYQDGIFISNAQVDECYSYCIARPGGQFTRLVPVDMLPRLAGVPARQADGSGMVVLPAPGRVAPNGQSAYTHPLQLAIESAPASPTGTVSTDIQSHIDSIIASSPVPAAPSNPKRTKIYCDKWIHDGTCAFTQQGCKYKHEMPSDKETQEKLGLFHGYPAWWKKLQVEQQRPIAPLGVTTAAMNVPVDMTARLGHPTPGQEAPMGRQQQQAVHQLRGPRPEAQNPSKRQRQPDSQAPVPFITPKNAFGRGTRQVQDRLARNAAHSSPFGPIAPPSKADAEARADPRLGPIVPVLRPSSDFPSSNPYSMLASLDGNDGSGVKKERGDDKQERSRR